MAARAAENAAAEDHEQPGGRAAEHAPLQAAPEHGPHAGQVTGAETAADEGLCGDGQRVEREGERGEQGHRDLEGRQLG